MLRDLADGHGARGVGELAQLVELGGAVGALRVHADEERTLRLRPWCGIGLARSHREIMPRYAPPVTALADRLAARTLELVNIPSQSGSEEAIRERLLELVPDGWEAEFAGDEAFLFAPPRRPGLPLDRARGALRHRPGAGQPSGTHRGRLRARSRSERHEGRARGRSRARPRRRPAFRPLATSHFSSSGARSCRPSTTRSPRSSTAPSSCTRPRLRSSSSRPTSRSTPGVSATSWPSSRSTARAGMPHDHGSPTALSSAPSTASSPSSIFPRARPS